MMAILGLVAAVMVAFLTAWFWKLELTNRRHTIFVTVAITYLVEIVASGPAVEVPRGILRLSVAGFSLRPTDVVLVAAMAAHLRAGRTNRISPIGFAWAPFVVLYTAGVFVGVARDLPAHDVFFQGKAVFYIVGGALVASGADVNRLARAVPRVGLVLATLVPIGLFLRVTGLRISIDTPLQRFPGLGVLTPAVVTVLVGFGGVVILSELVRRRPRALVLVAGVVLLLAPLIGSQRGSYLSLLGAATVLLLLAAGSTWRRRSNVTVTQLVLGVSLMLGAVLFGFIVTNQPGIIVERVDDAFSGVGNEQSAEERIRLYDESFAMIAQHPWIGSGVGSEVTTTRVATDRELSASAHNIVLDLWLRVGLVGLIFFIVAVSVTFVVALKVWRHGTPGAAAVAAGGIVVLMAFLPKAAVEPALDNYRLSMMIAFALGCIAAAWRTVDHSSQGAVLDREDADRLLT